MMSAEKTEKVKGWSGDIKTFLIPAGLESSKQHNQLMISMDHKKARVVRQDGNPRAMFKRAAKIIERTYTCPYLAHNTLEPMNFFADVTDDRALGRSNSNS